MPASGRGPISPENTESNSRRNPRNSSKSAKGHGSARLEVIERIGEGTLWIVYRVRERGVSGAPVRALKALKNAPNRHPRLPDKLFTCTLGWQKLDHPMLAPPHEVGTEEGTLFQTMEYLPGGSLESRLGRNTISAEAALNIIRQIASGLAYLHEKNIFHGDIRPSQILFDNNGTPKITDGGVAEAFSQSALALADVQGEVAYYLAPERTQGSPFSAAADVYSLGVVFYRMLTGRVPFDGASTLSIAARHRTDLPVPPSQLRTKIPAEIEKIALQMLEKEPADRPTASQIAGVTHSTTSAVTRLTAETIASPSTIAEEDDIPIPTSNRNTPPIVAKAPKRKPLNDLVAKQLADDAQAKSQVSAAVAKKRHIRREFWGFLGATVWLLVLIGAGGAMAYGAYYYWVSESPKEVVVPKYIGLDQEKAKQVLASKGLFIKVVRESYDPKVPAGTVLQGEPEAGRTVRSRREVTVTVSAGRSPIKMVDFSRLTLNQARQIIVKHGLRLGSVVQQYHPTIPDTFICGQYPDPGEPLRRSEPITLIVSRGAQPTEIDGTRDDSNVGERIGSDPLVPPSNDDTLTQGDFTPLEQLADNRGNSQDNAKPKSEKAVISVQVPSGAAQNVRILVRDSLGERTVFQEVKRGGSQVKAEVTVTKANNEVCLVRVYIGEELVREQEF